MQETKILGIVITSFLPYQKKSTRLTNVYQVSIADVYRFYLTRKLSEKVSPEDFSDLIDRFRKNSEDEELISRPGKVSNLDQALRNYLLYNDPQNGPLFHFRNLGFLEQVSRQMILDKITEIDREMRNEAERIDLVTTPTEIDKQAQYLIDYMAQNALGEQLEAFEKKYKRIYEYLEKRVNENPQVRLRELREEILKERESKKLPETQKKEPKVISLGKATIDLESSIQITEATSTNSAIKKPGELDEVILKKITKEEERARSNIEKESMISPQTQKSFETEKIAAERKQNQRLEKGKREAEKKARKEKQEERLKKLEVERKNERELAKKVDEERKTQLEKEKKGKREAKNKENLKKLERQEKQQEEDKARNLIKYEEDEARKQLQPDYELTKFIEKRKELEVESQKLTQFQDKERKKILAEENKSFQIIKIDRAAENPSKNKADNRDYIQLFKRIKQKNNDLVKSLLITKKFDLNKVNEEGSNPLFVAVEVGCLEIVKTLLSNQSSPNLPNKDGDTALVIAILSENLIDEKLTMVKTLLESDADPNLLDGDGDRPIHVAIQNINSKKQDCLEIVKILLEKGADHTLLTKSGLSALGIASGTGYEQIIKILTEKAIRPGTEVVEPHSTKLETSKMQKEK